MIKTLEEGLAGTQEMAGGRVNKQGPYEPHGSLGQEENSVTLILS